MVSSRVFLFVKHKPAYELRLSDWSSDVCSSVLPVIAAATLPATGGLVGAFAASPDLLRLLGCIAVALLAGWEAKTSALRSGTGPALALAGGFSGWDVAASSCFLDNTLMAGAGGLAVAPRLLFRPRRCRPPCTTGLSP